MRRFKVYKCSNCGLAVIINGEEKIKACNCNAPILADMEAHATGTSSIEG